MMENNIDTQAELALFAGTTQGEWIVNGTVLNIPSDRTRESAEANANFCARAHNEFPAWMAEIDKGREAQRKLEDVMDAAKALCREWYEKTEPGERWVRNEFTDGYFDCLRRLAGEGGQDE